MEVISVVGCIMPLVAAAAVIESFRILVYSFREVVSVPGVLGVNSAEFAPPPPTNPTSAHFFVFFSLLTF